MRFTTIRALALSAIVLFPFCAHAQSTSIACQEFERVSDNAKNHGFRSDMNARYHEGWYLSVQDLEIVDKDKHRLAFTDNEWGLTAKAAVGDTLRARFLTRRVTDANLRAPMKFYSRWIGPRATTDEVRREASRCLKEWNWSEKPGYSITGQSHLDEEQAIEGRWVYLVYTSDKKILARFDFNLSLAKARISPDDAWLIAAYSDYFLVQKCIEMRATPLTANELRSNMSTIEKDAKDRKLDTESLWKKSVDESKETIDQWTALSAMSGSFNYEQRTKVREGCALASASIVTKARDATGKKGAVPKKDF